MDNKAELKKMTFDEYIELVDKLTEMNDPIHDYGMTQTDMERMESDLKSGSNKYVNFIIYLSTRDWYTYPGNAKHVFINTNFVSEKEDETGELRAEKNALPADIVAVWLDQIIRKYILNDEDDESENDCDEDEQAAMRALLGLS